MEVQLGKPVYCESGTRLGTVDRVVVDPTSMAVVEFIVHRGVFLTDDRIVDREYVHHVDEDGSVHLRVPAGVADEFPPLSTRRYILPSLADLRENPFLDAARSYSTGAILWRDDYQGRGYVAPARSVFEMAPAEALRMEVESNLPSGTVIIDRGTDVRSSDNRDLGSIDEVIYSSGKITAIVVESGWLFHRPIAIPASWIESISHDHIRLSISAEEARSRAAEAVQVGS
jgi:uncharacterized protein YrrD